MLFVSSASTVMQFATTLVHDSIKVSSPLHVRTQVFQSLTRRVTACCACSRMCGRTRVLSEANGSLQAHLLFVAEAPGRLGADVSGIPLYGDQTGRNFQALLDYAGIQREDVFITNAVLCNPRDELGNNALPTQTEVRNCSAHLRETIGIIQPHIVVALGNVALRSLNLVEPHTARLSTDVGRSIPWNDRWLIPLYHPGPRARLHRSVDAQKADFQKLALQLNA